MNEIGRTEASMARSALLMTHLWAPREALQSFPWTGAANPIGQPAQHFNLFDPGSNVANVGSGLTGSFENRAAPWTYRFNGEVGSLGDPSGTASLGAPIRINDSVPWMTNLMIHLHDDVPDAPPNQTTITFQIRGFSATNRPLKEEITIGSVAADTYVRTRFAYSILTEVTILRLSGGALTADDYLEIGYDPADRAGEGAESRTKIGLPRACSSILDITAVKGDTSFVGQPVTAAGSNAPTAHNSRGWHAIDLVRGGAIFDRRDNSILVNTQTELTRANEIETSPAGYILAAAPGNSRHGVIFTIDPRRPTDIVHSPSEIETSLVV